MMDLDHISKLQNEIEDFIDSSILHPDDTSLESAFASLVSEVFSFQASHNPIYHAFAHKRGTLVGGKINWQDLPFLPIVAFKEQIVSSLPAEERQYFFASSGTTLRERSRHFHSLKSLSLYERSLLTWFRRMLLKDRQHFHGESKTRRFIFLTPPPEKAPHSSLAHMFGALGSAFNAGERQYLANLDPDGKWVLDYPALEKAFEQARESDHPIFLAGTAFSFVHLLDALAAKNHRLALPKGSIALETGGYKGQSREIKKEELHDLISSGLGIQPGLIVSEYGMSELSSQAYDRDFSIESPTPSATRKFKLPPWARGRIINPETLHPAKVGEVGILQIVDLANLFSCSFLQTEDLALNLGDGFMLAGRLSESSLKGCSLESERSQRE